ncbi:MAG: Asp-tRNA(Asn)/Glu-tRNA(Gln) amidotransferase subunit GatA [Candidatus Marinimicrobia bacterium]|nr:Asp-tRNA(Asn)/Glu-tRNA(Gln) amidotransferase subunit GatA [Candidatus Neomarinimicrobiota bacterium]
MDLEKLNIKKAHDLMQSGDLSARELLTFYLENIKKYDGEVHAFLETFDDAFERAEEIDEQIKKGNELPLLAGIPMGIKDNILINGKKCSASSKMLENFVAPYDATVIDKLKKENVVFVGRTNMDEFAMGSSTEHSAFGVTKNPHDLERVAGGSSGGSAAAVAQQECLASLGSDTAGSIRQPASFCGVVGMKPTYGTVSRYGLIAMASSFDQIGPITKSVEDAEIIFDAIKGQDKMDSTTVASTQKNDSFDLKKFVVGVPKEFFSLDGENEGLDEGVVKNTMESIGILKSLGAEIKQISLETLKYAVEIYYVIMPAEVSSNLARFDGVRYGFSGKGDNVLADYLDTRERGFGDEVRKRILLGTYVLSAGYYDAYYGRAQKARDLMKIDFEKAFGEVDLILSPTTTSPAFKIGEKIDDPIKMYLEDIFTCASNLSGVPSVSIPSGMSSVEGKQLPTGIQFMAPWFEEKRLFEVGKIFEQHVC